MAYAQIEVGALRHPKVLTLSDAAFRLWVAGLAYCQEHLTDGRLPAACLVALGVKATPKLVDELVVAALWERTEHDYHVHDYLDWNRSRALVEKDRAHARTRAAAARERAGARAGAREPHVLMRSAAYTEVPSTPEPRRGVRGEGPALHNQAAHRRHVACGQVCLPDFLFADFVRFRGGDEQSARDYVQRWWTALDDELQRDGRPVVGDEVGFLKARWAADHPTPRLEPRRETKEQRLDRLMGVAR